VWLQKISIPPPKEGIVNSGGERGQKPRKFQGEGEAG